MLLLVGAAVIFGRDLGQPSAEFDEAVYLASARALAGGAELGREVFSSQPPLFFAVLELTYRLAGESAEALRVLMLLFTLGGAVAAWALVRPMSGAGGGLLAAALFLAAPAVGERAAVISADIPAISLGVGALAAAAAVSRRPWLGAVAGGLLVAALMVKLLAVPFVPAVVVGLWAARAGRAAWAWAVGGAAGVTLLVLLPYLGALDALWNGAVGTREAARRVIAGGPGGTDWLLVTGYVGLGLAGLVALLSGIGAPREWWRQRASILALFVGGGLFLLLHRPLYTHHYVVLSAPLALFVASAWTRLRAAPVVIGIAVALLVPLAVRSREAPPENYSAQRGAAVVLEDETTSGQRVLSDLPLVPLMAGRETPPETIDVSYTRMGSDPDAPRQVAERLDEAGAVVAGRSFLVDPALLAQIEDRFPRRVDVEGIRVYLPSRSTGRPSGPIS